MSVKQPGDVTIAGTNGTKFTLKFDSNLANNYNGKFKKAQVYVDTQVIRLMAPLTPYRTGYLKGPSIAGNTKVGSGMINQCAPYARRQYYEHKSKNHWFEVMKARHKDEILEGARKIMYG